MLLDLVNDGLVLQHAAVVCEIDFLGRFGEDLDTAAGVVVALLEGLERGGGLPSKTEGLGDGGPVEFECCASLEGEMLAWEGGDEGELFKASIAPRMGLMGVDLTASRERVDAN